MEIHKTVKYIIDGDIKGFEESLKQIEIYPEKVSYDLFDVVVCIIYKNNIEYLQILIDFLVDKNINVYLPNLSYLANANQWDMMKLILDSNRFNCRNDFFSIFESDNPETINKMLEYGLITQNNLDIISMNIESINMSHTILKDLCKRYPGKINYKKYLCEVYLNKPTLEIFKELLSLTNMDDPDIKDMLLVFCSTKFNLEKYNLLVQKIPNEMIINILINLSYLDFHPDLIDVIGIRDLLQNKLNQNGNEGPQFSDELLMYSRLNFSKQFIVRSIIRSSCNHVKEILENLPPDFFTNEDKSNLLISNIKNRHILRLIKCGWRIYDTPENRQMCIKNKKYTTLFQSIDSS